MFLLKGCQTLIPRLASTAIAIFNNFVFISCRFGRVSFDTYTWNDNTNNSMSLKFGSWTIVLAMKNYSTNYHSSVESNQSSCQFSSLNYYYSFLETKSINYHSNWSL